MSNRQADVARFTLVQVHGFDFHFRVFQGVLIALPVVPVDTVPERFVVPVVVVVTVQVGLMTVIASVPPTAFVGLCAPTTMTVVVLVLGAELVAQMIRQRITFKPQQIHVLNGIHVM